MLQRIDLAQDAIFDPLARIRGFAETVLRAEENLDVCERREFLQDIIDASDELDRLLHSVLELTRLQAASLAFHVSSVDLERITRQAIVAAAQRARANSAQRRRFRLITDGAVDALTTLPNGQDMMWRQKRHPQDNPQPLLIVGDRRLVRTALVLALESAMRASPVGGAIDVYLEATASSISTPSGAAVEPVPTEALEPALIATGSAWPSSLSEAPMRADGRVDAESLPMRPSAHLRISFTVSTASTEPLYGALDTQGEAVRVGDGDQNRSSGLTLCRFLIELQGGMLWIQPTFAHAHQGKLCIHCVLPLAGGAPPT